MVSTNSSAAFLVFVATFASACEPGGADVGECSVLSHEVRAGELFDVVAFGHDFSPYCEAGFQAAQDHGQWVADAWEEPPNRFDYGLFDSSDEPCWPCKSGSLGCAFAAYASATEMPERHEIAHSIRGVPCSPLIEEGWATLYGGYFWDASTEGDLRQAADSVESGVLAGEVYPFAARFVAFLLETRGLDDVKALCQYSFEDADTLDAALMDAYGQSLDEVEAEFQSYPEWSLGHLRQDQACAGGDVTSTPGSWNMDLVCGGAGVEGREGGRLVAHHLIELPSPGHYVFQFNAPVEFFVRMELRSCERDGMASVTYIPRHVYGYGAPKEVLVMDLPAGVYVFRLMLEDTTEPLELDMAVQPWP